MNAPKVSIVMATYNSSHLLRYAIESVRLSDFTDWEAVVIGDHCTDDTAEMIASLGDERVRFLNLERNSGQQATPNNVGLGLSRGEFIAFLNQDDMFLPGHLSTNVRRMETTDVDLICCPCARILPEQRDRIEQREVLARLQGFSKNGRFDPRRFHVASSWFMRRELADRIGPWRLEDRTFVTPSQDWLFRAWRGGARIVCPQEVTVVTLYSGERKDSYRRRDFAEHDFVFREIVESGALRPALAEALEASRHRDTAPERSRRAGIARLARKLDRRLRFVLGRLGIHPNTLRMILRYGGRGGYIRHLKKTTG